jgi:hypothetical protein
MQFLFRLLSKIEASLVLADPCDDQEMITDEEKSVFRRIGLRLKAYLPLGKFLSNYLLACPTVSID